jgi:hypothetical protein
VGSEAEVRSKRNPKKKSITWVPSMPKGIESLESAACEERVNGPEYRSYAWADSGRVQIFAQELYEVLAPETGGQSLEVIRYPNLPGQELYRRFSR